MDPKGIQLLESFHRVWEIFGEFESKNTFPKNGPFGDELSHQTYKVGPYQI